MLKTLLGVARINFLTLTLACIFLALSYSLYLGATLDIGLVTVISLMGLAAHISVNAFNEYFDFRSGLDFLTPKTPFSGGSGSLVANPSAARAALMLAIVSVVVVIILGIALVYSFGMALLWIGIPGVVIIYTYTQFLNRSVVACLLAPGIGFGLLMTLGAFWLFHSSDSGTLATSIPLGAWLLAIMVSALVSNLLLVNQYPDIEADSQVGRYHLPIAVGRKRSTHMVAILHVLALLMLPLGVALGEFPVVVLWAGLSGLILVKLLPGLYRLSGDWQQQASVPLLGLNVLFIHLLILATALPLLLLK